MDSGSYCLGLALVVAGYASAAALVGAWRRQSGLVRSAEFALMGTAGILTLAVARLLYALLTHDFQIQYVADTTDRSLPLLYLIAALWGGQSGSLLFWSWLLSLYGAVVVLAYRHHYRRLMPWVVAALASMSFFSVLIDLFVADPFIRLPFVPADGRGLNPLLQHPVMAIHPPVLYLGMVGLAIPYAFALAGLALGDTEGNWLRPTRRALLIAWGFLGLGLMLGAKWAYVELGWGGYWGWDPVENSSLIPWLGGTAFLHAIILQQRRGMLKKWNYTLAIGVYGLCILSTFIARSGLINSVHAFARSSIGPFFAVFLALVLAIPAGLLMWRRPLLRSVTRLQYVASRETVFVLNLWILLGILCAVLWGTLFPLLSEVVTGTQIILGPSFFDRISPPLGLVLLLLMGAAPLFAWRGTRARMLGRKSALPMLVLLATMGGAAACGARSFYPLVSLGLCGFALTVILQESLRGIQARRRVSGSSLLGATRELLVLQPQRYGGYIVHIAVVLLFIGFTGKAFDREEEFVLRRGESVTLGGYSFTFATLAQAREGEALIDAAAVTLRRGPRLRRARRFVGAAVSTDSSEGFLATLLPERRYYPRSDQSLSEVAIYPTLWQDLYFVLVGYSGDGAAASFQLMRNRLVQFVWAGGLILALGTGWCAWAGSRERRRSRFRGNRRTSRAVGDARLLALCNRWLGEEGRMWAVLRELRQNRSAERVARGNLEQTRSELKSALATALRLWDRDEGTRAYEEIRSRVEQEIQARSRTREDADASS